VLRWVKAFYSSSRRSQSSLLITNGLEGDRGFGRKLVGEGVGVDLGGNGVKGGVGTERMAGREGM